jgi:DNA-binding NtrC family response regulator
VRELENVIERAVVLCNGPRIGAELIPDTSASRRFQMPQFVVPPEGISFKDVITDFEKRLIESTLEPPAACRSAPPSCCTSSRRR